MTEFRTIYAIYICAAVILVLIFISFIRFGKRDKFQKGKKAVAPDYILNDPYYKRRVIGYQLLKFFTGATCLIAIAAAAVLIARPYTKKITVEEKYSRDIFLCMDISTSVDELNAELVDKLKNMVSEMSNERFGVVIFNTSPVVVCPLTSDYEYVIEVLDKVGKALEMRNDIYAYSNYDDYDYYANWIQMDDYISSGTLIDNERRGSSLIGDGLAATVYNFPDLKEDPDRVRLIIFSTDNDIQGTPIVTLPEAADICKENNVIVYGIGTDFMYQKDELEMEESVLKTGGKFYIEEESGTMKQIVRDIDSLGRNLIKSEQHVTETEHPEKAFYCLLIAFISMIVFIKISKR